MGEEPDVEVAGAGEGVEKISRRRSRAGSKASGHTSSVQEEAPAERGSQNDDAKKGDKNPVVDKSVDNHPFTMKTPQNLRSVPQPQGAFLDDVAQSPIRPTGSVATSSRLPATASRYLNSDAGSVVGAPPPQIEEEEKKIGQMKKLMDTCYCFSVLPLWLIAVLIVLGILFALFLVGGLAGGNSESWLFGSGFANYSFFSAGIASTGVFSAASSLSLGLFSTGFVSFGLFSVGFFSVGVFSIGVFSVGILSIGHIVLGIYAFGGFAFQYKKDSVSWFPRKGLVSYSAVALEEGVDFEAAPNAASMQTPARGTHNVASASAVSTPARGR